MSIENIVKKLIEKNLTITAMESCTGGYIISEITNIEGSSAVTEGGYVTYSNNQKIKCGVSEKIIEKYGVYSAETAEEMSEVCRKNMKADIGIGVTGTLSNIDPNNKDSVQGEVYFAASSDKMKINRKIKVPVTLRQKQKETIGEEIFKELEKIIEKI